MATPPNVAVFSQLHTALLCHWGKRATSADWLKTYNRMISHDKNMISAVRLWVFYTWMLLKPKAYQLIYLLTTCIDFIYKSTTDISDQRTVVGTSRDYSHIMLQEGDRAHCITYCQANSMSTARCSRAVWRLHTAPSKPQRSTGITAWCSDAIWEI